MNTAAARGVAPRLPFTVIGGYLGAGKTTLLNRLLVGDHGRRLAVLVNDFGPINIDVDLIRSHDGQTISLENGCVCCSIADALGEGLDRVLTLEPQPDQIIVEASGVADPGKIASYGRGWPGCRLDGVLVLADAETIMARATDQFVGELVTRQLRRADIVLVTKCDLVSGSARKAVTDWARQLVDAPVVEISHGAVDPELVLDLSSAPTTERRSHRPVADRPVGDEEAGRLFTTDVLPLPSAIDRPRLEAALARWPDAVVRVKGVVYLPDDDGAPRPHVVHRVGRRWSIEPVTGAPAPAGGAIVVIARRGTVDGADLLVDLIEG